MAEDFRGPRLIAAHAPQHAFDESLLEFSNCLVEKNSPLHHLTHEPFQLVLHGTLQIETLDAEPATPIRAQSGCSTIPGTWHALRQPPLQAIPGRAGFSASECSPGSRAQTACRKRAWARQVCTGRRAKTATNPA